MTEKDVFARGITLADLTAMSRDEAFIKAVFGDNPPALMKQLKWEAVPIYGPPDSPPDAKIRGFKYRAKLPIETALPPELTEALAKYGKPSS